MSPQDEPNNPWDGGMLGAVQRCANGVDYWCCSLDADVPQLLSKIEWEDYSSRSLQAAVAKGGDLLPCPKTDCPGIAVRGSFVGFSSSKCREKLMVKGTKRMEQFAMHAFTTGAWAARALGTFLKSALNIFRHAMRP
ncbi:hypothetical protein COCOBI_13-0520 [Coccomyxa sp. Obi]|nr:hypothetical protein COCOBI_13-0520 [Coccomyxa sp. Obi]